MIFYLGLLLMILNEGFVILRHVSPYLSQKRDELIAYLGPTGWRKVHGSLDVLWILLVGIGFFIDIDNWKRNLIIFGTIWGIVAIYYVPVIYKKIKNK
jgi:hypothetical protein